jgi:regulator of protease activity HflC (stomatin/prohibitin superfamily)
MEGYEGIGIGIMTFLVIFLTSSFIIFSGFDMVDANHLGVMNQMGELKGIMQSGIKWTGMFTKVYSYDMRIRKAHVELSGINSAVDKTGQYVSATIDVNYRIKSNQDVVLFLYKNIGTDDVIDDRLNIVPLITEGFKQASVKYDALEILDKRQEVKELAKENIKKNFPEQYFEISDIVITNIDFSKGFKDSIEAKKQAEQDAIKEQNLLEVVKFQQQQEIERYKAEAEKLRLQKSEITALLIQQQWIQKWDGHLPSNLMTTPDNADLILSLPSINGDNSNNN